MRKAGAFIDPQGKKSTDNEKTIFIWLDILGFAEALENEEDYQRLEGLLYRFRQDFSESDSYETYIISDGIILSLKNPSIENLSKVLREIGIQQFKFTSETKEFIRGGISLGSRFGGRRRERGANTNVQVESYFISNGLARAVKIESTCIIWPVIGTTANELNRIRKFLPGTPESECFELLRSFNTRGEDVFFIDFLNNSEEMLHLINHKIGTFKKNSQIRAKYIWLLKYYIDRFGIQEYCSSIEGAII